MAEAVKDQSLRNSTGKLKATAAKGVDKVPNYLRASTGSCHDVCKYGTPHEFKAKPKIPVKRRSMPNAEIPVEIFVPSDKRSTKAVKVKPSSVVPDVPVSTKLEVKVAERLPSVGAPKSIKKHASLSTKVRTVNNQSLLRVSKQTDQETRVDVKQESSSSVKSLPPNSSNSVKKESEFSLAAKSSSPDSSNSVKQESKSSSLGVKSSSPDSSKSVKQESSFDVKSSSPDSSNSVKQESSVNVKSLNSVKKESSLVVKSSRPDSSISAKQESLSEVKSSQPGSSVSAKEESSSDTKSLPPDSSISAKQESSLVVKSSISAKKESSSDVKPPSFASSRKVSSSQRRLSTNASKLTVSDVPSRRKSTSSNVSGFVSQIASKPVSSPHLMSGSTSKTPIVGRKSSSPGDLKSVKVVKSLNGKSPLKNTSSTSNEQSSSRTLTGRTSAGGLRSKRITGSKMDNDSEKETSSPTRKSPEIVLENITTSSTVALTCNLPGTNVASLNVSKNIAEKEGGTETEATSDSKKLENEEISEKTLHVIEVESNMQSPESVNAETVSIQSIDSLCQSKSPFSSQDAVETNSESEYTESEADDDDSVNVTRDVINSRTSGKSRVLGNEENGSAPVKLKFRRGKVIDPQCETSSPKKLRFRRRSISGNDQRVSNERRRSFKGRDNTGVNADDKKPVEMKVVLRHQDVQEKKNEKGLLNVVIEKTASMLVETRKSKVKALVGAFESVISGEKPSPHSSPSR